MGRGRFRGKAAVEVAILAPLIVPPVAYVFGVQALLMPLGLVPTAAGVALAHLVPVLPYVILVMAAVFANQDARFEDQALSLGASRAQVWRHVTLPAIRPGLTAAALFAFLVSWGQYLLTLAVGGGRVTTPPLALYAYLASGRNDIAAAIAALSLLPGIAVILLARRALPRAPAVAP
ncbi:MAG: ABC transporter permease subunit [Rhodobacteraceae bacterium]|nr:ABC transporter permease subunit [Paracoccaceae bacterium]